MIPDSALDDRLGFVGTAGSGKTYGAGTAVERILSRKGRCIIPDPLGVWFGLRLRADGKTPSPFEVVIFGGPHGDLPLNEHAGALIGETVAGMKESAIVDLSDLGTKAAERRFMLAFLTALYRHASGDPVHLVFDEADMWAPQKLLDKEGEAARLLGMMETIVRRGRIKGFIPWLITQRPAVVNKDVLSQVDGLAAFKLTSSNDRDALGAWVEGQADDGQWKTIYNALPTKARGEAVVWLPGHGVLDSRAFPAKTTFDSSRTPKRGEARRVAELKPLDLGALKDRLAKVEAETKANDPKLLRAEIGRLTAALAKAGQATGPTEADLAAARTQGFGEAVRVLTEPLFGAARQLVATMGQIGTVAEKIDKTITDAGSEWDTRTKAGLAAVRTPAKPAPAAPRAAPPAPRPTPTHANGALSGPQHRILDAVAWWNAAGFAAPSRTQVAFVAGYKPNTGTFNTYLGALSTAGLIAYPTPGQVALTGHGARLANQPEAAPTAAELQDRVRNILSGPQAKLLDVALDAYPEAMPRDTLAERSGYQPNTGTFNTYLGSLSTLDIVTYPERGKVQAAEWLFP